MYDFTKRRGAVSIFLVIVLVPMLMVSSIFVDMSRLQLARSAAASAGDLALNTALTDYDAVLKDMYGLFATSQDIDELLENLEDYYRKSIEAAGVPAPEADNYVDQIMGMLKSSTGTDDLMNMNLTEFEVTKPTGGNLANPAILKTQIVDFMKYRAPLNLGTGFLEAIKSMKNLDKQTDLANDKTKYYEQQKGILENLEKAWKKIQVYQYSSAKAGFPTGAFLSGKINNLNAYVADGGDLKGTIIPDTIKYLYYKDYFYNNQCSIVYTKGNNEESVFDDKWTFNWFGTTINCDRGYMVADTATTDEVLAHLSDVMASIKSVKQYTTNSSYNEVYKLISTVHNSDTAKIYAVAQYNKAHKTGYALAVKDLLMNLVKLESAMACCTQVEMQDVLITYNESDYTVELAQSGTLTLYNFAKTQVDKHLHIDATGSSKNYFEYFNEYTKRLDTYVDGLAGAINSKATTVNTKFDAIRDEAYSLDTFLGTKIQNLTDAISILNGVKSTLSNSSGDYQKSLENWKNAADALSDESMGQADLKEIEDVKNYINADKVGKLITRLTDAKASLESARSQLAEYKFEGVSWKDIPDGSGYKKVIEMLTTTHKNSIQGIVPNSNNNNSYDSIITDIRNSVTSGNIPSSWEDAKHPDLTKQQSALYTWLYNNYYDPNMSYSNPSTEATASKSGDDELSKSKESLKTDAKKYADEKVSDRTTKVTTNITDYSEYLPSAEWGEIFDEIKKGEVNVDQDALLASSSSNVSGLIGKLLTAMDTMGTTLRDNTYITNYIMTMFSYDTYEAEVTKKVRPNEKLTDFKAWYEKQEDGSYKLKDAYKSDAPYALSLTKNSINPNMNYLYGSEVEYIIYGGENMTLNKTGAYGTIFLIRFAFNTVYAFTDAEINNTTLAAATAIFGTPPLTPLIPLAKTAMTIGLAIAESAYDLYQIKLGEAVQLMKDNNTWVMKPSGAAKAAAKVVAEVVVDESIKAGYEVLNDLLEKTDEELENMINSGTSELNDLATAVGNSTVSQFKNYANEAIQKVVALCNEANLNEMMDNPDLRKEDGSYTGMKATDDKVNYVCTELNKWLESQNAGADDAIYEVKKLAVDSLVAENGKLIKEVFSSIESTSSSADTTALDKKLDDIQAKFNQQINKLSTTANTKLNEIKNNAIGKIEEAAKNGAESLRNELKAQIGKTFGSSYGAGKGTTNVMSSLLSWSYSDYLTLFLLVATLTDLDAVLLRTADVVELNMQHMNGEYASITTTETKTVSRFFGLWKTQKEVTTTEANQAAFKLKNSYTYLSINAKIEVKPLLMALPFMENTTNSQLTGTEWYEIEYKGTLGY